MRCCMEKRSQAFIALIPLCCTWSAVRGPKALENDKGSFVLQAGQTFPFTLIQDKHSVLDFTFSINDSNSASSSTPASTQQEFDLMMLVTIEKPSIIRLNGNSTFSMDKNQPTNFSITLKGLLPGRTTLQIALSRTSTSFSTLFKAHSQKSLISHGLDTVIKSFSYEILVEREERIIDVVFTFVVIMLVVCSNVGMGSKVDIDIVKSELRRPFAPTIGLCSQFLFMPLVAFVIAYNMDLDPGIALGYFALGCSPGGSGSNAYTYLLEGNVSLSVTMTLISTMAALVFLPLWLFTLGQLIFRQGKIKIPFQNIVFSLIGILIPVVLGLVLQKKLPRAAEFCVKSVKYIMIIFVVFVLTVGVYANVYIFHLVSAEVALAAALLPYVGFVFGGLMALVLRQSKENVIAIAVETGIQNVGIPIVLLRLSLSGPEKDTGIVPPVISALFTPLPLVVAIVYITAKKWLRNLKNRRQERTEMSTNLRLKQINLE